MSRFSETAVKASMKMYFFYYSLMCHRGRPTWQVKSGIATLVALRIRICVGVLIWLNFVYSETADERCATLCWA